MKSPLQKLKKLGLHKSEPEENLPQFVSSHMDELNQAAKDVEDMKASYDALFSSAAATINSAYEFSESLQEMGNSLLDESALHDDEETGKALSQLGRVQHDLQKLFDGYRSQIISTVSNPSESFLTELRKVEEMKLQCDEKRELFEHIVGQLKEKGKTRHGKLTAHTSNQLKAVHEEYDETARLCIFRIQSLKKGQCRSLLTLAAHHHAAQLNLFRKGLHSLEALDTHIRNVAERQRIDYQLSTEECDDGRYSAEVHGDGDLSFKYNLNEAEEEMSRTRNEVQTSVGKSQGEAMLSQGYKAVSHSAPLYSEMRPSAQKSNTHVLPTPDDAKGSSVSPVSVSTTMLPRGGSSKNLWHSSPLDVGAQKKAANEPLPSFNIPKPHLSAEENSSNKHMLPLPPRLTEADSQVVSDGHKFKRQAFSGPLASKPLANKPHVPGSGPISSNEIYGSVSRASGPQPLLSASMLHSAPPIAPSPKVSELHELPRPPSDTTTTTTTAFNAKPVRGHRHSAPLVNREREISPPTRSMLSSNEGSPLPLPHLTVSRSFSIPSSSNRIMFHSGKLFSSQATQLRHGGSSPPLSPAERYKVTAAIE